jgi:hypothetical protein
MATVNQLSHKLRVGINIPMMRLKIPALLALAFAVLVLPLNAPAGSRTGVAGQMLETTSVTVTGKLLSPAGQPIAGRTIHFENVVTGDTFLTRTGTGGAFSALLPPATYNLREEPGPIVMRNVQALTNPIDLGTVNEPQSWWDFLEGEKTAPAQIHSPAPITSSVRPGGPIQPALRTAPLPASD